MAERQARILALGDAVHGAVSAADWEGLRELASALAPALNGLAARGPWSAAELAALQRLRSLHEAAAIEVGAATAALRARLDDAQANKDGWRAYALHSDSQEPAE
jgi:hypothetical protein